jgi:putative hydrolase of the HAD superfamily
VPERRGLEAVLFDAGGTLVRLDFEWMSESLRSHGIEIAADRLRRSEVEGRRRYDLSRGRTPAAGEPPPPLGSAGDTHAYFGGMLRAAGVPEATIGRVLSDFDRRHAETGLWTRPMEGARAAIDGVAALALRCAVVSNSDGRAEMHLTDCGVREGIEFVVDSHLEGVEKPDPRIARLALDRLGVAADRTLFVGDIRSVDEAVARAAGMHFVLIDPYGDYGADLQAAPGASAGAIAAMEALPAYIVKGFEVPGAAARALARGGRS